MARRMGSACRSLEQRVALLQTDSGFELPVFLTGISRHSFRLSLAERLFPAARVGDVVFSRSFLSDAFNTALPVSHGHRDGCTHHLRNHLSAVAGGITYFTA